MTQTTDAVQPVAWIIRVLANDGDAEYEAAEFHVTDEAGAQRLADDLRTAYTTATDGPYEGPLPDYTVAVVPVLPVPAGRAVVKYTGYAHPALPASRRSIPVTGPGRLRADVEVIPAGEDDPAWVHQVQIVQNTNDPNSYAIIGADPEAVRAERDRLWAELNPEA